MLRCEQTKQGGTAEPRLSPLIGVGAFLFSSPDGEEVVFVESDLIVLAIKTDYRVKNMNRIITGCLLAY